MTRATIVQLLRLRQTQHTNTVNAALEEKHCNYKHTYRIRLFRDKRRLCARSGSAASGREGGMKDKCKYSERCRRNNVRRGWNDERYDFVGI